MMLGKERLLNSTFLSVESLFLNIFESSEEGLRLLSLPVFFPDFHSHV